MRWIICIVLMEGASCTVGMDEGAANGKKKSADAVSDADVGHDALTDRTGDAPVAETESPDTVQWKEAKDNDAPMPPEEVAPDPGVVVADADGDEELPPEAMDLEETEPEIADEQTDEAPDTLVEEAKEEASSADDDTPGEVAEEGEGGPEVVVEIEEVVVEVDASPEVTDDEVSEPDTTEEVIAQTPCVTDEDCAALDDGDFCNGLWWCDAGWCTEETEPVVCPFTSDTPCVLWACNSGDGSCIAFYNHTLCADENPCTEDICFPDGCKNIPLEGKQCNDGDLCTTQDSCVGAACLGGAVVCDTSSDGPCEKALCDQVTGSCEKYFEQDGTPCGAQGACENGVCVEPCISACANKMCGDNGCGGSCGECAEWEGVCSCGVCGGCGFGGGGSCEGLVYHSSGYNGECGSDGTCVFIEEWVNCDDENPCTNDACDDATPNWPPCVHTPIACNDDEPCTDDVCNGATGECEYAPLPFGTPCDDGNLCTTEDVCAAGACTAGTPVSCDDGSMCTTDACASDIGCTVTPTPDAPCDDSNPDTIGDWCEESTCVGAPAFYEGFEGDITGNGWTLSTAAGAGQWKIQSQKVYAGTSALAGGTGNSDAGSGFGMEAKAPPILVPKSANPRLEGFILKSGPCEKTQLTVIVNDVEQWSVCGSEGWAPFTVGLKNFTGQEAYVRFSIEQKAGSWTSYTTYFTIDELVLMP